MAPRAARAALLLAAWIALSGSAHCQSEDLAVPAVAGLGPFSQPDEGADFETLSMFRLGNAVFRQTWTPAGQGRAHFDGLGPLYNAPSCESCHVNDGRGRPPGEGGEAYESTSMIVNLASSNPDSRADPAPDPNYGHQLQDFAIAGLKPEGRIRADYSHSAFTFADSSRIALRAPRFSIADRAYGPLDPATRISARIAPPMIGLGLIARIAPEDILSLADPDDRDGDGISGRARLIAGKGHEPHLGRFGWKAGQADLAGQIALALSRDMGISSGRHPMGFGDCTSAQRLCRRAPDGNSAAFEGVEAHSVILNWLLAYSENLAVPAPRQLDDPEITAGRALFSAIACARCHRAGFVTGEDTDAPHLAGREIAPYSDFLLHDMGPDLAGGVDGPQATAREWRTAPLWGIGLTGEVNGNMAFLHDGRARSITEAIAWHGGEAASARDAFAALTRADRARLLAFVEAL